MGLGQLQGNRQSQPHPLLDATPDIPLVKRLEKMLGFFQRDALATITHQDVLDALRDIEPSVSAPWAAERAIEYYLFEKK